jgi:antitoxin YefM
MHIEDRMPISIKYAHARTEFAKLLNLVANHGEIVIIQSQSKEDVALIAASELQSLMEMAYLLRSPANAKRLVTSLNRAVQDQSG